MMMKYYLINKKIIYMCYYVYIYLNPFVKKQYMTTYGTFEYEPIYVGKGKNNRAYIHINSSSLKINNHRYKKLKNIIDEIGYEEYKNNYIIKVVSDISNEEALYIEHDIMSQIGTFNFLHNDIKLGPLLNFSICGNINPILFGENNGMYGKNVFDIWKNKYSIDEYRNMINNFCKKNSESNLKRWERIKKDKEEYKNICHNIKKGVNEYWSNLSEEQYNDIINIRSKNFKKFYKKYKNYKNYCIEKYGIDNGIIIYEQHISNISNNLKSFWENASEEFKEKHSSNTKKSIGNFYNKYKSMDNYLLQKYGLEEYNNRKKLTSEKLSKSINNYWNNLSEDERLKISNHRKNKHKKKIELMSEDEFLLYKSLKSGKNNPMYGKGHLLSGNKNGRAIHMIIHMPNGEKYYCNGTFKKFCNNVLKNFKPLPHRKYLNKILKEDIVIDGWYFKKVDKNFNFKDYIKYE